LGILPGAAAGAQIKNEKDLENSSVKNLGTELELWLFER